MPPANDLVSDSNSAKGPDIDALVGALVRERRLIALLPIVAFVGGLAYVQLRQDRWVSESNVRPVSKQSGSSQLSGLAAQFGLAIPNSNDPIKFYAEVARSNQLMRDVLASRFSYKVGGEARESSVFELLDVRGSNEALRMRRAVDELRSRVDATTNEATGTLRLRVIMRYPEVSESVNRRVLGLIDSASMRLRRGQASSERQFVSARLGEAQAELRLAEEALANFMRENRVTTAPQLRAEEGRLQRQVDFRQQVAVGLAQSLEQARIDEVRNTPVLGMIDPPEGTAKRANRMRDALIWPLAGLVIAVALALAKDAGRRLASRYPTEWSQVRSMLRLDRRRVGAA